uniref:CSTF2_hinge domain-containing protein n=1 Tax=Glossina pallidipes TaxID=7398 RepID=A0A1A9ZHK2_GLOPL
MEVLGFCESKDQETALSAMRNLNGYEIGGRTEKSRMEIQQLLQGPQVENACGEHCDPDQAPEIITKTVASLPPEQMYELMKQMKLCIQNNPSEARQMLMLNPQLAYALLQAMMKSENNSCNEKFLMLTWMKSENNSCNEKFLITELITNCFQFNLDAQLHIFAFIVDNLENFAIEDNLEFIDHFIESHKSVESSHFRNSIFAKMLTIINYNN